MLVKKLLRTIWKYKVQFFSMVLMIMIGVGVFVGFNVEWKSIEYNTEKFFAETGYADYRIYRETGFTAEDLAKIKEIDGVQGAVRSLNVSVNVKNEKKSLGLTVIEDYGSISSMLIMEGEEYNPESDGIYLSDKFAEANDIGLYEPLVLTYNNIEITGSVVSLVKSSEYMVCVPGDDQIMPDYNTYGFCYITPHKLRESLNTEFYSSIFIQSELDKTVMQTAVDSVLEGSVLLLSKEETTSYAGAKGEISEGKTMGSVIPVLFLLIAVLTMVTTMHRITTAEKTQIGTLKALGFKNRRILLHYTSFGFFIGILGTLLGAALGYGIAAIIVSPTGTMATYFDLPQWTLVMPWFGYLAAAGIIVFLTLIGFLSVRKMLAGTAADSLRPYTPKKMKRILLERTGLWEKLSFKTRWNTRDIFRHKSRTLMTLFGIVGCMLLLVGGLGMKDTMDSFTSSLKNDISQYNTKINLTDSATNLEAELLGGQVQGDTLASSGIQFKNRTLTLEIYDISHDTIRFLDKNNNAVSLEAGGAYICMRIADEGVHIGDIISFCPYGSDTVYQVKVIGILRSMLSESITMTREYAESVGIDYKINTIYTKLDATEIPGSELISSTQTKESIVSSFDSMLEVMNLMVFILVIAAVVLGVVVLYNLGTMSYIERYRELATLKVVGFKNKHIGKILISQNIWLTILGILIGLPAGVFVVYILLKMLATEYELKMTLGILTYSVSILLTFGVSLIVGFFVAGKNRHIDMVEALKGVE